MIRCSTCVLPVSPGYVELDQQGTCQICNQARRTRAHSDLPQAAGDLSALIADLRERGKGRQYDCLVGLSGGRDSTYLLYLLVKQHGLRCVAAYYRTPFTPDTTDRNARQAADRLGVPLIEMDIDPDYHQRVARDMFTMWEKRHDSALINLACAPCKLVTRELFRIAKAHDVGTVVSGGSKYETFQLGAAQSDDEAATQAIVRRQGSLRQQMAKLGTIAKRGLGALGRSAGLWKHLPIAFKASVMYLNPHTVYMRIRYRDLPAVDYFYHAEWNEEESEQAMGELGWELPAGCNSVWRSDCAFAELKNYMFYRTTGVTYTDTYLSNMVRAGVLTRDEALKRLETEGQFSRQRLEDALEVLGLERELEGVE